MPGGEGSPINLLDHHHRASTAATSTSTTDECANGDDVRTASSTNTGTTFTSAMTSALAGDGLRRRKVIHAARETLDKGESGAASSSLRGIIAFFASSSLTKPREIIHHRGYLVSNPFRLSGVRISGSIFLLHNAVR